MIRLKWPILALFFGLLSSLPLEAKPNEESPGTLIIQQEGGALTVRANQVPHRQILEGLAKQLDFELIVTGPLDERRTMAIEARPWEEALKRALTPLSWAFVYRSTPGEPELNKVFVFPAKPGGAPSPSVVTRPTPTAPSPPSSPPRQLPEPLVGADQKPDEPGMDVKLNELLEADDEETRALALIGLATMGGEQAITALKQALQDREPWIRETAVEALAELGGEQAIQGLEQALGDDNADVRRAAQEALSRLGQDSR
jgi:hypothetical protein